MEPTNRFAILNPEVGLDSNRNARRKERNPNKQKNGEDIGNGKNKGQSKYQEKNSTANKGKKKKPEAENDLIALAFGIGKKKGSSKGNVPSAKGTSKENIPKNGSAKNKEKKPNCPNGDISSKSLPNGSIMPDADWKKRDEEFIKNQNEQSLREAILLSKLDYEACKSKEKPPPVQKPKVLKKAEVIDKTPPKEKKIKKKKEKPLTLSLDQFNSLKPGELEDLRDPKPAPIISKPTSPPPAAPVPKQPKPPKEKFFQDVEEATKSTLDKEKSKENQKATTNQINHILKIKKLTSEIEKRDFEIQALRLEVDSLRDDLKAVKSRNKKLCEVISHSELRSKGELVLELEKVTKSRDEFAQEVATISGELEQEKTKASQLSQELKKIQGKKRSADSSSKC